MSREGGKLEATATATATMKTYYTTEYGITSRQMLRPSVGGVQGEYSFSLADIIFAIAYTRALV